MWRRKNVNTKELRVIKGTAVGRRMVRAAYGFNTHSLTPSMPTHNQPAPSASRHAIRGMEYDAALRMTRTLRGAPAEYKHILYGVRRKRSTRLAGHLPEMCLALVEAGAPLGYVLALPHALEQACIEQRVASGNVSLEVAMQDETDAQHELDAAQLVLAAHPNDLCARQRVLDAAYRHEIAIRVVRAVIATMNRTPEPPRAA